MWKNLYLNIFCSYCHP